MKKIKNIIILFLDLNNKIKLIYNDVRKFGFIKILKTTELKNKFSFKNTRTRTSYQKILILNILKNYINNKRKSCIKNILMDQKFIAGLGNIYVNEILFKSGIKS